MKLVSRRAPPHHPALVLVTKERAQSRPSRERSGLRMQPSLPYPNSLSSRKEAQLSKTPEFFHFVALVGIWLCLACPEPRRRSPELPAVPTQQLDMGLPTAGRWHLSGIRSKNQTCFEAIPFLPAFTLLLCNDLLSVHLIKPLHGFCFPLGTVHPCQYVSAFHPRLGQSPKVVGNHITPMREWGRKGQRMPWGTEMAGEGPCRVKQGQSLSVQSRPGLCLQPPKTHHCLDVPPLFHGLTWEQHRQ